MILFKNKFYLYCITLLLILNFNRLLTQPPSTPISPMASTDGTVLCVVRSGNTIYIGGGFALVRNPDNSFELRNNIAAIDATTGFVLPWNPNADGAVLTMALSGTILYVGGAFNVIGGQTRYYIGSLKTDTDFSIATDWNPQANFVVNKIIHSGTTIYAIGSFSKIGNAFRDGIAALTTMSPSNNALSWNPAPNDVITDIALIGNTLYVTGSYNFIGGQSRNRIAALSITDASATSWNPNSNGNVRGLAYLGNTLYAMGDFTNIGGQPRVRIAALNMLINTNNATAWNPDVNGTILALNAFDNRVYIGGTFSIAGGQTMNFLASLDALQNTNNATSWNPILNSFVEKINIQDSIIYIGGNFSTINGLSRSHFAMFQPVLPTITTRYISDITINSAVSGGNITADGGPPLLARGVCWSINHDPTINDSKTIDGTSSGTFTSNLTGLDIYCNYYVRAYATNAIGTAYGNEVSFYSNPAVYTGNLASTQFCVADSVVVPYEVSPGFEKGNYFIAQLSDKLGSFDFSINLDSINSKESGEIHTQIPLGTEYGVNYRFRVIATQPSSTLRDNNTDIQINELPVVSISALPVLCVDNPVMDLEGGSPPGGTYSGKGVTNNKFNASVAGAGSHTITYTYNDGFGCSNNAVSIINVNPLPVVIMQIQPDICIDAQQINLTGGTPAGGSYSGNGISGTTFNPKTAGVGKHTITYSYTDSNGCSNTSSTDINVNPLPVVLLSSFSDLCLNSEPFVLTGGTPIGGVYTGTGVINNEFTPSGAGVGTHVIQYTYIDNKGCTDSATNTIKVKPIPPKPVVTQLDYRTLSSSADSGNQWFLNGIIMPNDTSKILHPKASANYSVQVSGTNGCQSDMSDEYLFHNLAVNDLISDNIISIYPNPADDEIFIKMNTENISHMYISINNLLGEKLISKEIFGIEGNRIERIRTNSLTVGVYLLNITIGDRIFNKSIIIQR